MINLTLEQKEQLMETLLEFDFEEAPNYVLNTFGKYLSAEQNKRIQDYIDIMCDDETGDDFLDTDEQIAWWQEIEGYIGITEDDWGKYSVYSYKLTGVRVENAIPKTYDNSSEKGKEELKELYDILMQTRRELGRRKFKDLAILYDNYYDVFLTLIQDIIEIDEV